jgi:hypothetical protein
MAVDPTTRKRSAAETEPDLTSQKLHITVTDLTAAPSNPPASCSDEPAAPPESKKPRQDGPAGAPPTPPAQDVVRSGHIIYPDQYASFDPAKIAFAATPVAAKEGGGQILFMSYVYPDGQTRPLLLHTPRGMHCPTGVKLWKDGKSSILMSCGRDHEASPLMKQFRGICDCIQNRGAQVAVEKS